VGAVADREHWHRCSKATPLLPLEEVKKGSALTTGGSAKEDVTWR